MLILWWTCLPENESLKLFEKNVFQHCSLLWFFHRFLKTIVASLMEITGRNRGTRYPGALLFIEQKSNKVTTYASTFNHNSSCIFQQSSQCKGREESRRKWQHNVSWTKTTVCLLSKINGRILKANLKSLSRETIKQSFFHSKSLRWNGT